MSDDRDSIALAARQLIRRSRSAALATSLSKDNQHPYASLVTTACDLDCSPIMLFSGLSDHTKNLATEPRASLLFEQASRRRNPQTGPRVTLCGTIRQTTDPRLADRFLNRHPDARRYAGFGDFSFYIMAVERLHWVGGFASARWMVAKDALFSDAKACANIAESEVDIISHMNTDHADALDVCARALANRQGLGWQMAGIDPEGFDLCNNGRFARVEFDRPITNTDECRSNLVVLTKRAWALVGL